MTTNEISKVTKEENVHKNHRSRVKERFLKYGLESFEEHQVIEMALFFALPHVDTNEMAHKLINKAGSFTNVFDMPIEEMKTISGIKDNAATFIKFLSAFTKYYVDKVAMESAQSGMSYDEIGKLFVNFFVGERTEKLVACFFDDRMNLLDKKIIGVGDFSSVSLDFRSLTADVMNRNVRNIALAHNHPTHSPVASMEDVTGTKKLEALFKQIDVTLVEHFVIANDKYLGIMKFKDASDYKFNSFLK